MRKLFYFALIAGSLAACGGSAEPEITAPTVPAHLDGNWTVSSAIMGGNEFPPEVTESMSLYIDGTSYETEAMGVKETGTLIYYDNQSPKRMDITATEGPNEGTVIKTIYKLDGDVMTVSYNMMSEDYPTSFESTAENMYIVSVYNR